MIGVVPAAGEGKRLGLGVKALVKVRGRHLIEYPFRNLLNIGIKRAVIVENGGVLSKVLGKRYGKLELAYAEQSERRGIAHAASLAEPHIQNNEYIFIILGDIVYQGNDLVDMRRRFEWFRNSQHCLFGVKLVKDKNLIKESYGVRYNAASRMFDIIEKPESVDDLTPYMGLGIYVATSDLFDYIRETPVSKLRGEVEITDTLNLMARRRRAAAHILRGRYVNINTREDLKRADLHVVLLRPAVPRGLAQPLLPHPMYRGDTDSEPELGSGGYGVPA